MVVGQRTKLFLHGFNAAFHETVLPRAARPAGAERYAESRACGLMTFAQIFAATVTMQYGRAGVGTQCLDERDVCQATAVVRAQFPAQDLAGREIHHER